MNQKKKKPFKQAPKSDIKFMQYAKAQYVLEDMKAEEGVTEVL